MQENRITSLRLHINTTDQRRLGAVESDLELIAVPFGSDSLPSFPGSMNGARSEVPIKPTRDT